MAYNYQPNLVSIYTSQDYAVREQHEHYEGASYRADHIKDFIKATCKALGAVHHNIDYGSAMIYRPGDTHVLGEIGFKDIRIRGKGASAPQYYVRSRNISNGKYRDTVWQYNSIATNSLKNAVKHAENYFKPLSPEEAIKLTSGHAKTIIDKSVSIYNEVARSAYRKLFGDSGYGNKFELPIFDELRHVTFISQELNKTLADFYEGMDTWREAKSISERGVHYVGFTEDNGQLVADTAHCDVLGYYSSVSEVTRFPITELPEWVQGRIAVLQMLEPGAYVQGVGLRLDNKIFYVMGDKTE